MTLALRYAARSHTGLLRTLNEDSVYAGPRLLAVADGMGGHAAGEVASAVAIASIAPLDEDAPGADLLAALTSAAESANRHLRVMTSADQALSGMGTTLVALLFSGGRVGLAHIGDSRCYLLRDGELTQITHDHTLVQALVDDGRISEEEANSHPQKAVVTNVMDGRDPLQLDLSVREARVGDRYLVCSDGLTGPVGSLDTLRASLELTEPQEAVDRLVQLALRGGGPDNVTVIVADVIDTGSDDIASTAPVIAGSAAESPQEAPEGIADSAASRARVAEGRDLPPESRAPAAPARSGRRTRRNLAIAVALVALLAGGAAAGWSYVRAQYYVGFDHDDVAIFRGVQGSLAGIHFSSLEARTTLTRSQLSEVMAERVDDGIPATDAKDARAIIARLIDAVDCTPVTPTPAAGTPTPATTSVTTPTPTPTPVPTPTPATGSCP